MKGFVNIRIDDRLIHGQVANRWATGLHATRIMVIDDQVANDPVQKPALRMAAPEGIATSIITEEKAIANIKADKYANQRVLLVVKRPKVLLDLLDAGLTFDKVNIGNMSNRPNTTQVKKSVSLTDDERADIKDLLARGVNVTAVMVPDDPDVSIEKFL